VNPELNRKKSRSPVWLGCIFPAESLLFGPLTQNGNRLHTFQKFAGRTALAASPGSITSANARSSAVFGERPQQTTERIALRVLRGASPIRMPHFFDQLATNRT
jgi:hypothetical protein